MADTRYIKPYPAMERHRAEMQALRRRRRWRLASGLVLGLALVGGAFALSPPLALLVAGISVMVLFFASIGASSSVSSDELVGVEGELRTLQALEKLPDDCVLFNRVMLPDDWLPNGQRELDFIVVAPTGLFVVEVKNPPGRIHVDPDARYWPLVGRGCGGRPDWQAVANPLPQVKAQAEALERWLLRQGLNETVQAAVCFSRPEVVLENTAASPIPVMVPEQLADWITRTGPAQSLEAGQLQRLIQALSTMRPRYSARAA
jgi:hypothetical protein